MATTGIVAIIGGGLAGLAAARRLIAHGVEVHVVEATDRLGGRVRTIDHDHPIPVELGAEFVHGQPEATSAIVRDAGLELERSADTHHIWRGDHLVEIGDMWGRISSLLDGAEREQDRSVRDYIACSEMAPEDATLLGTLVEGFYAAPLDDISVASVASDIASAGGEASQARVRRGYAQLVRWLASAVVQGGTSVHHGFVVRSIDATSGKVIVDGIDEVLEADAAIITLPLGVLFDRSVTIRPSPDLGAASRGLAMGQAVKVLVCMRSAAWADHVPRNVEFLHRAEGTYSGMWLRSREDAHLVTAFAGGPRADALAGCSAEELAMRALADLAASLHMSPAALEDEVLHVHTYDFAADPFARGAYSYTRVGGQHAAEALRTPLDGRLFFAGEATDAELQGTVAGALASGARAADELLSSGTLARRRHILRSAFR